MIELREIDTARAILRQTQAMVQMKQEEPERWDPPAVALHVWKSESIDKRICCIKTLDAVPYDLGRVLVVGSFTGGAMFQVFADGALVAANLFWSSRGIPRFFKGK